MTLSASNAGLQRIFFNFSLIQNKLRNGLDSERLNKLVLCRVSPSLKKVQGAENNKRALLIFLGAHFFFFSKFTFKFKSIWYIKYANKYHENTSFFSFFIKG